MKKKIDSYDSLCSKATIEFPKIFKNKPRIKASDSIDTFSHFIVTELRSTKEANNSIHFENCVNEYLGRN